MDGRCVTCEDEKCVDCHENVLTCLQCVNDNTVGLNNGRCSPCHENCVTCDHTGYRKCKSCSSTMYLSAQQCHECPEECVSCTSDTVCSSCKAAHYFHNSFCHRCPDNCTVCEHVSSLNAPKCTECVNEKYEIDTNAQPQICKEVCGDSWTETYACDNAKDVPYDGCDNNCEIMENWECHVNAEGVTHCSYIGEYEVSDPIFSSPNPETGEITVKVSIVPPLRDLIEDKS